MKLFRYLQCDIEVPEHLQRYFSNFHPILKNAVVSRENIGTLMREALEKENIIAQPRRKLISSFHLTNGMLITALLLFSLKLGLVCKTIDSFVQYLPKMCFNNIVQSAVNARRRQGYENPNSSVVAETMKLLASSSFGHQTMDCSRYTVTKYLNNEETHSATNSTTFKCLNNIPDELFEVGLVKPEIEHRERIIVGFLFCNMINGECWNFTTISPQSDKYEELEMDRVSLY